MAGASSSSFLSIILVIFVRIIDNKKMLQELKEKQNRPIKKTTSLEKFFKSVLDAKIYYHLVNLPPLTAT